MIHVNYIEVLIIIIIMAIVNIKSSFLNTDCLKIRFIVEINLINFYLVCHLIIIKKS